MSTHVNFFIHRGNDFIPIGGDYSRNSIIYELVSSYAGYEKIKPLTVESIQDLRARARNRKEEARKTIDHVKERIKNMRNLAETWDEALEYLEDYETAILEYEEEIKEARYVQHFFSFLEDIIDTVRYDSKSKYNYNEYIYVGIEIGEPTVEDIVCQ